MAETYIVNAAPMVIDLGTQDLSTTQPARVPVAIPQHLPKIYLYAQKGPTSPQLVSGPEFVNMFGSETFNLLGQYANHATLLATQMNAQSNACMLQRVLPADIGPNANMLMSLDVLPTQVIVYQRNIDGSLVTDVNGNPLPTTTTVAGVTTNVTTPGYKVKWVVTNQSTVTGLQNEFGQAVITPGDQIDSVTNTQSLRYPMFEFVISSPGAYGNLTGIQMSAPTLKNSTTMPVTMMQTLRAYPYNFSVVQAPNATTSPKIVPTLLNDQSVLATLLPGSLDPTTNSQLYVGNTFIQSYQNLTDPAYPAVYGDFSQMAVYQSNIDTLLEMFYTAELPHITSFSDITSNTADKYLVNIASFVSSHGVSYTAVQPVNEANSVTLSKYTNVMAAGSSDGTMNNTLFADLVTQQVLRYIDPNDPIQDIAMNVESVMYDTGFPLATKQAMCAFVGYRHDTFVNLSTYTVDQPQLTQDQEMSMAISLRTQLQMYPESTYFGTPVMRGMIIGYSGKLLNSLYTKPVPLTMEVAIKSAIYMGASNGAWKNGSNFDGAPGSILQYVVNPTISWLPSTVRNKAWAAGLNWVQTYDRRSVFFPALKTIYSNDTSVLNSYFTALAICQLNKIAHAAWREFSGETTLTGAQLTEQVNAYVNQAVKDKFDNRFVIIPVAFFTDADAVNGFSWTLPIKIYSNSMETVMTTYVQAFRMNALSSTGG